MTAADARSAFLTGAAGALPSRTVAVLEAIKHAILVGELKPGRPLVETDLATVLGVSKTPVREALKTLAGAGLVTMHPYRGAVVRVFDDEQARHIYDLRLLLEPEALGRAVTTRSDWTKARDALERADACAGQAERSLANRDFHHELYAGCGNPLLVRMLDDLRDQTALVSVAAWRHDPATQSPEHPEHPELGARGRRAPRHPGRRRGRRPGTRRALAPRTHHLLRPAQFPCRNSGNALRGERWEEGRNGEPRMSLTQASTDILRRALATAVVVPVTPYQADGSPDWDTYATLISG